MNPWNEGMERSDVGRLTFDGGVRAIKDRFHDARTFPARSSASTERQRLTEHGFELGDGAAHGEEREKADGTDGKGVGRGWESTSWLLTTVARPGLLTATGFSRPAGCGGSSMWEEVPLEWV